MRQATNKAHASASVIAAVELMLLVLVTTACSGGREPAALSPSQTSGPANSPSRTSGPADSPTTTPGTIVTVVGTGRSGENGLGGPADQAELQTPIDLAFDADGNLFIAERYNHRILTVDREGILRLAAGKLADDGSSQEGYSGDGGPATQAALDSAMAVEVGPDGELYIADTGNNRIRKVGTDGIITTVAGTGERGHSGDGGPAAEAKLAGPTGMAFDGDGNLFFADLGTYRVRRIDPEGLISTVAGTGAAGSSPDGTLATDAQLGRPDDHVPNGLAFDRQGRLHITDQGNSRIWMVDEEGRIRTAAGNGRFDSSGDGGQAADAGLNGPLDIAFGPDGSLYIATHTHGQKGHHVRVVDEAGVITTVAGTGAMGYGGDGGPANEAVLNIPSAVAIGQDGSLYIADAANNRIRMVLLDGR